MLQRVRANLNAPVARAQNLSLLLHTIQRLQPISRVRLARTTGISTTTVTNLVQELMAAGVVVESGHEGIVEGRGAGRPAVALRLAASSRCAIGVHIGVRAARIGLVDLQGSLLDLRTIPHEAGRREVAEGGSLVQATEIVAHIVCGIEDVLAAHATYLQDALLVGIGVGASGLVESRTGINILAPRLGWRDLPIASVLRERLEGAVGRSLSASVGAGLGNIVVDNNVRTMALAESLYGVCRNVRALAFVYARVGVGAGLVVDGDVLRGAEYGAGEIGHWAMIPHGGELCGCGNHGCLETLISERVLLALAEEILPDLTKGRADPLRTVLEAARDGHLALVEMLEDRAYYVGLALANLVNTFNPEAILLGGWLSEAFDLIEPVASGVMRRRAFAGMGHNVDLLPTSFGAQSGVIGAGVLALERFLFSPEANLS